ncbi:hypothetical protein R1flu_019396 [Riccia fluitans]|uniref:Uncharacterized protein n=1 Tax=Riccia fluitans TaxID=41844 RepID=A0ABD1ZII7_9MARC
MGHEVATCPKMQLMILGTIKEAQQLLDPNREGPSNVSYIGTNNGNKIEGSIPGLAIVTIIIKVDAPRLTDDEKGKALLSHVEDVCLQTHAKEYQNKAPKKWYQKIG